MHSIAYDEVHDELVVTQQFSQAILTFRGAANGEEPPLRIIQGPLTQLSSPDQLAIDPAHNEIFVPEENQVLVFARETNGNGAPVRILMGPDTMLGASTVAVDPVNNLLLVSGIPRDGAEPAAQARRDNRGAILIFNRTDQGNVKPRAVIRGPKTSLGGDRVYVYPPRGEILAVVRPGDTGFVGVWNLEDHGDVPPRWTIGGPNGALPLKVKGVALDPKNQSVIIADRTNAIFTYHFPEIF